MTWRGILLGLLLALCLSAASYYNDRIVLQQSLTATLLPVGVFGVLIVLTLLINPMLRLGGERGPLRPGELAIIVVLGLAACSYPSGAFSRYFGPLVLLPGRYLPLQPSWQSAHVFSYVPGGSAHLGEGHVRDWPDLARRLDKQARATAPTPGQRVLSAMTPYERRIITSVATSGEIEPSQRHRLLRGLNRLIDGPSFYDARAFAGIELPPSVRRLLDKDARAALSDRERRHLNRALLHATYPQLIRPEPRGSGVLLLGGHTDPKITETTVNGSTSGWVGLLDLPWAAWWPVIRVWGGLFVLLATAQFCIVLIIHPQWSRHEVLPYPLVQVVELMIRRQSGRLLPDVAKSPLFWYGFGGMVLMGVINGLHSWFPAFPLHIPTHYDLMPLLDLFPKAGLVPGSWGVFRPSVLPFAVAFAYFLNLRVSFSMGISMFLWMAMGIILLNHGISLRGTSLVTPPTLIMFGAGVGFVLAIVYYGRRHYRDVLLSALGWPRPDAVPSYCVWAMRWLAAAVALTVWLLYTAGIGPLLALLFTGLSLMVFLIITRVGAETGALMAFAGWAPTAVIAALLGAVAIGPTAYIVLLIGGTILVGGMSNAVMPQLANAICLADRTKSTSPGRTAPWVMIVLVVGLAVSIAALLLIYYNLGTTRSVAAWGKHVAHLPFDYATMMINHLSAWGQLETAMSVHGLGRLSVLHVQSDVWMWGGLGLGLMLLCLAGYLLVPGWPLHPVLFVFWGTFPSALFHVAFLLGWAIKAAVVRIGGTNAYQMIKPLMVGVIGGQLAVWVMWIVVTSINFALTHQISPIGKSW